MKSVSVIDLATLPQVPGRLIGMDMAAREASSALAGLICADPQWLDAEFSALVAASFGKPPAPPPPALPQVPADPGGPTPPSRQPVPGPAVTACPVGWPEDAQQRSPPP
jgi:hypothetical protein